MEIKLNELTLENFAEWPSQIKMAVSGLVFLLIILLGYLFLIKEQLFEIKSIKSRETDLKQQYEFQYRKNLLLEKYKRDVKKIRLQLLPTIKLLPKKAQLSELLEKISELGVESGLKFESFKPLEEEKLGMYGKLPVEIVVIGDYHQLANFINKVGKLNRIVTLQRVLITHHVGFENKKNIGNEQSDVLIMSILLSAYHRIEEGAAQEKEK